MWMLRPYATMNGSSTGSTDATGGIPRTWTLSPQMSLMDVN
jgi:hypothetical protein